MFKFLKNVFTADERPLQLSTKETWGGTKTTGNTTEQDPLGITNEGVGGFISVDGTAKIRQMKNGKFRLLVNQNEVVGTYGRKRDAIRGASRKGLMVVEA